MKVILTFYSGEVREFETEKSQFVIGRSPKSDIAVSVDGISRSHCLVEIEEGGDIYITDLASTNGVMVDNKKIPSEKRTLYNLFLNLSLGPIQSVQFDLGEKVSHKIDLGERRRKTSDSTTTPQNRTGKFPVDTGKNQKKKIDFTRVFKFLIPVVIFLCFFFLNKMTGTDGAGEVYHVGEDEVFSHQID